MSLHVTDPFRDALTLAQVTYSLMPTSNINNSLEPTPSYSAHSPSNQPNHYAHSAPSQLEIPAVGSTFAPTNPFLLPSSYGEPDPAKFSNLEQAMGFVPLGLETTWAPHQVWTPSGQPPPQPP
jgi:hypothetical protein